MAPGESIDVERLGTAEGKTVELDRVLLIADGGQVTVGRPTIPGAKVVATSRGEVRGTKLIVFKYKPKVRYHKKTGHRQLYTRLVVDKISQPGAEPKQPVKKSRRKKKEVTEDGA